ncbi:MAG: FUSC family protein [Pseudonocardiaceae bacterium]|nr:FUSC family protein [Pseudonocardiaceae bacterium]
MARRWTTLQDRLVASDPGLTRLRLAGIAVGNLALTVGTLLALGAPLPTVIVGSMAGVQSTFLVRDATKAGQALTLALIVVIGSATVTVATVASRYPLLPEAVFLVVIFLAVFAQRFGPRGTALGAVVFFLFFFSIFLRFTPAQVPALIGAIAVGLTGNALMRFVVLPRRPEAELLRVRRGFRARLAGLVAAITDSLETHVLGERATPRRRRQLRRLITRLHECALMIEEVLSEDIDLETQVMLQRRVVEVELAAERLLRAATRTDTAELTERDRAGLVARLRRLHALIERDPAELPLISRTDEFSEMLGDSSDTDRSATSWPLRQAIAQLALADARAQRLVQRQLAERPVTELPLSTPDDEADTSGKKSFLDEKTRQALQAFVAGGLAIVGGELVSPQRWYWAVITVFVVFVGTSSRGTMFVKGFRRLAGTIWGILGGLGAASLVSGSQPAAVVLIGICVFCFVYVARVSQGLMAFFMTTMLGLLYSLLGTFSVDVLVLRLGETVVGVAAGMLAALVIVPIRTRQALSDQVVAVLEAVRNFVRHAQDLLSGVENVNLIEQARTLDREIGTLRSQVEPVTHPFNPYRGQREHGWYVQAALDTCAFYARDLAVRAEPAMLSGDDRLVRAAGAVAGNLDVMLAGLRDEQAPAGGMRPADVLSTPDDRPAIRAALDDLTRLDSSVFSVARALGVPESADTER